MMYIDVSSNNDFDRAIKYLSERGVTLVKRDKLKWLIVADVSEDFISEMSRAVEFEEVTTASETPLDPNDKI